MTTLSTLLISQNQRPASQVNKLQSAETETMQARLISHKSRTTTQLTLKKREEKLAKQIDSHPFSQVAPFTILHHSLGHAAGYQWWPASASAAAPISG